MGPEQGPLIQKYSCAFKHGRSHNDGQSQKLRHESDQRFWTAVILTDLFCAQTLVTFIYKAGDSTLSAEFKVPSVRNSFHPIQASADHGLRQ